MSNNPNTCPNPDHYALVIGINGYVQLQPLRGAVEDATRIFEWLVRCDGGGLSDEHVELVLSPPTRRSDPFVAEPMLVHIDRALTKLGLTVPGRIGKRFYFFFAGHGYGSAFDDVGMLLANAAPNRLTSNYTLGLRSLRSFFRKVSFDEVVFVLDCCRDQRSTLSAGEPGLDLGTAVESTSTVDYVVMAALYGEKAVERIDDKGKKRTGLLTDAVLEGLEGAAADLRWRVTAATLTKYVRDRVPKLAGEKVLRQTPEAYDPPPDKEIVLATIPPERLPIVHVQIVAAPQLGGELVLKDGTNLTVIDSRPADSITENAEPWALPLLRTGKYRLDHTTSMLSLNLDPATWPDPFVYRVPRLN